MVDFQGAPDFSPTRIAEPGPTGFPLAKFQPGAVAGPGYSPFIRIEGSPTVYSAPIVATGDGPFDVVHHTNTGDRVLGVHVAGPSAQGQFAESWVDLLFVKGLSEPKLPLMPQSNTRFMSTATPAGFEFVKDAQGRVTHLIVRGQAGEQRAVRKATATPK